MKKLLVVLFLFVGLFLTATSVPQARAEASCVDLLAYPDNTVLGPAFTLNGFAFQKLGGFNPFVNVFPDANGNMVHGVQFPNAGLTITLPTPSGIIAILIGLFDTPGATIQALNASGGVEDVRQVPADHLLHQITLTQTANPIVQLRFTGGGNKGVINEICH